MDNLFSALKTAPGAVFTNITPTEKEASHGAENRVSGENSPLAGEVSEQQALDGARSADLGQEIPNNPTGITAENRPAGSTVALGSLLEAKMAIELVDAALPALAVIALQYFANVRIEKRQLQLTEKEKAILNPVLQNYLNSISFSFDNPLQALLITVGTIYGAKFAEKGFTAYMDKQEQDKKDAANADANRAQMKIVHTEITKQNEAGKTVVTVKDEKETIKPTLQQYNKEGYEVSLFTAERKRLKIEKGYAPSNDQIVASLKRKGIVAK